MGCVHPPRFWEFSRPSRPVMTISLPTTPQISTRTCAKPRHRGMIVPFYDSLFVPEEKELDNVVLPPASRPSARPGTAPARYQAWDGSWEPVGGINLGGTLDEVVGASSPLPCSKTASPAGSRQAAFDTLVAAEAEVPPQAAATPAASVRPSTANATTRDRRRTSTPSAPLDCDVASSTRLPWKPRALAYQRPFSARQQRPRLLGSQRQTGARPASAQARPGSASRKPQRVKMSPEADRFHGKSDGNILMTMLEELFLPPRATR